MSSSGGLIYSTHLSKRKGEDFHAEIDFTWRTGAVSGTFFLLLDGHGGVETASFARQHLCDYFLLELDGLTSDQTSSPRALFDEYHVQALQRAFLRVNAEAQEQFARSGATCTAIVFLHDGVCPGGRVFATIANVGDSHVYAVTPHGSLIRLNEDHRAGANKNETKRIESTPGCELSKKSDLRGPLRLFPGGLMMTRSLGDAEAGACCSADPAITRICAYKLRLVLASDGLWDALSTKEIGKLAMRADNAQCSRHLMMDASKREGKKFGDDVTVTVIDLPEFKPEPHAGAAAAASEDALLWSWKPLQTQSAPEPVRLLTALRNEGQMLAPTPFAVGDQVILVDEAKSSSLLPQRISHVDYGFELYQIVGSKKWIPHHRLGKYLPPVQRQEEELSSTEKTTTWVSILPIPFPPPPYNSYTKSQQHSPFGTMCHYHDCHGAWRRGEHEHEKAR